MKINAVYQISDEKIDRPSLIQNFLCLCIFGSEPLKGQFITIDIDSMSFLEFLGEMLGDSLVEFFAAETRITGFRKDFCDTIINSGY